MRTRYKTVLTGTLIILGTSTLMACLVVAKLAYPATPSNGKRMKCEGHISLPRAGILSVLDYITTSEEGVFVTSESNGSVYKVNLHGSILTRDATVSTFAGQGAAHGVVIDPVSKMAYVTRSEANTVDVFDPKSLALIKHIPVADDPDGIFYDPSTRDIYVASGQSKLITLIDPIRQETVAAIRLSGEPEFAVFDSQNSLFYQNLTDTNTLAVLNTMTRSVIEEWPLPGCKAPSAMSIDSSDRRLFIACSRNARLLIVNLETHKIIESVAIGGGPDAIVFDQSLHRLYIAGKSGVMSVVQQFSADDYRIIDSIHTHYGAHTLALDPATHRIYVGYASLFVAPRLTVFTPQP